jgi:type I restriction enzyme, R subunit
MRLAAGLDHEAQRAVREGLDEESVAVFDMLVKPDLSGAEIARVKKVSKDLLARLKEQLPEVDAWQEKEGTRDAVRQGIHDFLWSDDTGLPVDSYTEDEVQQKAGEVYLHVFQFYGLPRSEVADAA